VRFAAIAKLRQVWPLRWLCATFEVTCAGFYAWLKRPQSQRACVDEGLMTHIHRSFLESDRTYGARRVRRDLCDWGHGCGIHRVERLMRRAQLVARPRRRRLPFDCGLRPEHAIAPNVLDRQFAAAAANCKWVADFTYLWTAEGWLYVAAVIDLFSRRVVGWSMSSQMTAQLVTDAMLMAIWRRGPVKALLAHSDQGSQYTSEQFQRLLKEHGVTCSMSRSGNCWDNAAMESFFSTLKTERTSRRNYQSRDEARADVFDYIERFYNLRRRHSTLGYLSPADYEKVAHSG
jgi:putative transposase